MLSLSEFFDGLRIQSVSFHLPGTRQHSRTAGGEVLSAVLGNSLWQGSITVTPGYHRDMAAVQARVELLDQAGDPFLVHSMPIWTPRYDPDGSIIAGYSPTIENLNPNNRRLLIAGLPPGYRLQAGDFLSFEYGENPTRYALHRVVGPTRTANSEGNMNQIDVLPHIRPGATVGTGVTLVKPVCKAVMVPGSIRWPSSSALITDGLSFDFIQTLS